MSDTDNNENVEDKKVIKTYTQEELDEIVSGLKTNNDKLLSEKKAAQEVERQSQEEARLAREEAAKKSGDVEQIEKALNERHALELSELNSKLTKRDSLILDGQKSSVVNDIAGDFLDSSKGLGKTILNSMVEVTYNDDGKPQTTFKDQAGNLLTTDVNVFKDHLKNNDAFQPLLKGVQFNGGGSRSENSGSGGAGIPKTLAECNGDKAKEVAFYKSQKLFN